MRIGLAVADEAVNPEIDDADLDEVVAGVHGGRDVEPIRRSPDSAEGFAVDRDLGEVGDVA